MNQLFGWLLEDPSRLRAALNESEDGPSLYWLADQAGARWLPKAVSRLGTLGKLLAETRLPALSAKIWRSSSGRPKIERPQGSWIAFLESDGRGLLVPDDSGDRSCWALLSAIGDVWLPWRLYFGIDLGSLERVVADTSQCMLGRSGECVALNCPGRCELEEYVTPVPCRKCVCRMQTGR